MDKTQIKAEMFDGAVKVSKLTKTMKDRIIDLAIVFVGLVFVLRSVIEIDKTGRSVTEIIADSVMTLLFSFLVSRLLEAKGLAQGGKANEYLATMKEYSKIIEEITPHIDYLDEFCEEKNDFRLKKLKTKILREVGISYEKYISPNFDEMQYSEEKRKHITHANRAHLGEELSVGFLTSEDGATSEEQGFGRTRAKYSFNSAKYDIISKVGICVAFSYFGVTMIMSFSWAVLIWYVIQFGLFLVLGAWKYISAYTFMTDEHRNRIIRKINYLYEFKNEIANGYAEKIKKQKQTVESKGEETDERIGQVQDGE